RPSGRRASSYRLVTTRFKSRSRTAMQVRAMASMAGVVFWSCVILRPPLLFVYAIIGEVKASLQQIGRRMAGKAGRVAPERGSLRSFPRQLPDKLHRPLNPAAQLVVGLDAFRGDQHPALHRPPGDVELLDVRFLERLVASFRAEADDERILPDAHEQVAVQQEADAAKHLLLLDALAPGESSTDALGKFFAEGHRCPQSAFFAGQPAGILSGWAYRGCSLTTATGSWL